MRTLSDRIFQRDLDAFRAGIEEQVRREVELEEIQASFDRHLARRSVKSVKLIAGRDLHVGDTTAEPRGIVSYCAVWDIVDVRTETDPSGDPLRPGTIWVSYASKEGSGGQVIYPDSQLLVVERERRDA